ncbi:hypothetical protein WMF04_17515 [Sorangium sp. So ce260]|uniref:hypothetical protein n=1 Tax=Sorangium sp. So ce260 TaxID=3133291 RepID=UPI003F5EE39B
MKKGLVGLVAFLGSVVPVSAMASWQANPPGMTEYIACATGSSFNPIQWDEDWNDFYPVYFDSQSLGTGWWTYATAGNVGACQNWVRGRIAGGAGYVAGQASTPQGRNANIRAYWYDFNYPNLNVESECGHQHTMLYVWGWRYNGSSWSMEYVTSTAQSSLWNDTTDHCEFVGGGHPDYDTNLGYTHGNGTVTINNSPYAVLFTMAAASSHRGAGCGQWGCWHRVLVNSIFN